MKKFKQGDIVMLNSTWVQHCGDRPWKFYPRGRTAVVLGCSRTSECFRILFDGLRMSQTFHESFLTKTRKKTKEMKDRDPASHRPRLGWLNGKTLPQAMSPKNASGHRQEHVEALAENASRLLAIEIQKALGDSDEIA